MNLLEAGVDANHAGVRQELGPKTESEYKYSTKSIDRSDMRQAAINLPPGPWSCKRELLVGLGSSKGSVARSTSSEPA